MLLGKNEIWGQNSLDGEINQSMDNHREHFKMIINAWPWLTRLNSPGVKGTAVIRCPRVWEPRFWFIGLEIPGKVCLITFSWTDLLIKLFILPIVFPLKILKAKRHFDLANACSFEFDLSPLWQLVLIKIGVTTIKGSPCTRSGESWIFNVHLQMLIDFLNKHYDWYEESNFTSRHFGKEK